MTFYNEDDVQKAINDLDGGVKLLSTVMTAYSLINLLNPNIHVQIFQTDLQESRKQIIFGTLIQFITYSEFKITHCFIKVQWNLTYWLVTRHQYGIFVLVPRASLYGKTSGGITKCYLFSLDSNLCIILLNAQCSYKGACYSIFLLGPGWAKH